MSKPTLPVLLRLAAAATLRHRARVILLLFVLALGVRCFWFSQKTGLHEDESMSITLANAKAWGWRQHLDDGLPRDGLALRQLVWQGQNGLRDTLADLYRMHIFSGDGPHTNLYYSFLRLAFLGLRSAEPEALMLRGFLLNLLLFCLTFPLLLQLLRSLLPGYFWGQAGGLALAVLNPGSVSNTLLIRPYQLQEGAFVLFALVFAQIWREVRDGELREGWERLAGWGGAGALALLSGYFSVFYVFFLLVLPAVLLLWQRRWRGAAFLAAVMVESLLLAQVAYLYYFNGFFSDRGQGVAVRLQSLGLIPLVRQTLVPFAGVLQEALFSLPLLLLTAVFLAWQVYSGLPAGRWRSVRGLSAPLLLTAVALLWAAAIFILAPFKVMRYILPVVPLLALIFPVTAALCRRRGGTLFLLLCCLLSGSTLLCRGRIAYRFQDYQGRYAGFTLLPEKEVFLLLPQAISVHHYMPYLNDQQNYRIFSNWDSLQRQLPLSREPFLLGIFYLTPGEQAALAQWRLPPGYQLLQTLSCERMLVFRCRRL